MAEDFGVEDRGHFYDPVGALRDVVVNHLMQVVAAAAMEPPRAGDPRRCGTPRWRCSAGEGRRPGPLRPRPVRRVPGHRRAWPRGRRPRPTSRCGWRSTTGAGPACRSTSGPASGSPPPTRAVAGWPSGSGQRLLQVWVHQSWPLRAPELFSRSPAKASCDACCCESMLFSSEAVEKFLCIGWDCATVPEPRRDHHRQRCRVIRGAAGSRSVRSHLLPWPR